MAALALFALAFAACGGGSNGGNTGGNRAPTANAGTDQNVDEMSTVQLAGSGSDADGDPLSYSWTQTVGNTVTITDSDMATAGFTAPDVALGVPETLTFRLSVSDGTVTSTDFVDVTVSEPQATVTVSGTVNYEWVPPKEPCRGLDFNATFSRPIRGAPVQLLNSGGNILATTVADEDGSYAFDNVLANTMVRLRVRAELKQQGAPGWDVEVRDNTSVIAQPLDSRPLYVVDGPLFDTGTTDVTEIFLAETGWGNRSYTGTRAAAPFAILDTIYTAIRFVVSADATASFPDLDVFWSINNTADTTNFNIDTGELGTSFYRGGSDIRQLFLVGDAAHDTEEFDDHVVLHEWGHYFEDVFSRSDSIGGPHRIGDSIDARLAFGEGWASAFAAMALNEPIYCDTRAAGTTAGFDLDTESEFQAVPGWFNEWNVAMYIYDLWDTGIDGTDNGSLGFGPIFETMTGPQAATEAFTTIFSFATEIRFMLDMQGQNLVDSQLDRYNIVSGTDLDIWATIEANSAGATDDVLPLYTDIVPNGIPVQICSNDQFDRRVDINGDRARFGNRLSEYRLLRMNITTPSRYRVTVDTVNPPSTPPPSYDCTTAPFTDPNIHMHSDPDVVVLSAGVPALPWREGLSCMPNREVATTNALAAGTYVLAVNEYRYADTESPQDFPPRICFDVSVSQIP